MLSKFRSHRLLFHPAKELLLRSFSSSKNVPETIKAEENHAKPSQEVKEVDSSKEGYVPGSLIPLPKSEFGPGRDPYSTFPNEAKSLIHQ